MLNYWWVLVTMLSSTAAGYLAYKANVTKDTTYAIYSWLLNLVPIWAIVILYSRNLIFDGLLYDTVLVVSYTVAVLYFTNKTVPLNIVQLSCIGIIVLALLIFKLAE